MLRSRIIGLFRLFRFELPFTAGICVVVGELLALGKLPGARELALGFLSVFFISATALILNDYFDLESDRINAPQRPLPSGQVRERDVLLLSAVVTLLGLIAGYMLGLQVLLVLVLVWIVGFLYNWRFKKTGFIGNLMVCFSVSTTFVIGGMAVGRPFEKIVWLFAVWVMLIDLAEEIAADSMDVEGDRAVGSRSLACLLGREKALRISAAIFLLAIVVSGLPFLFGWLEGVYLFPIMLTDAVIAYSVRKLLDSTIADRRKYIRWIYLCGLLSLIILIIIRMAH